MRKDARDVTTVRGNEFLLIVLLSGIGCSAPAPTTPTSSPSSTTLPSGGGPNLIVPPLNCPDLATLVPPDAGACVIDKRRDFAQDIVPLFNSCAGEICHSFAGGAIATQIGIPALECCNEIAMIDPGHPERSYVLKKLIGQNLCAGSAMPLDQPAFPTDDLQAVSDWICQGANTTP
jgi:hypothetical protein